MWLEDEILDDDSSLIEDTHCQFFSDTIYGMKIFKLP